MNLSVNTNTVLARGATVGRALTDRFADLTSAKDFGATGSGTTDDTAALIAASGSQNLLIQAGAYLITGNITFTGAVTLANGAVLNIAAGKTVTFNAGFSAPVAQAFSGAGTVVFNRNVTTLGYPEWWGAVTGGPDCSSAFASAIAALPIVQLQRADYWVNSTVKLNVTGVWLRGIKGIKSTGGATGMTRLITGSPSINVLQIGLDSYPGSVNAFVDNISASDLEVTRAVGCASSGEGINNPTGVLLQYAKNVYLDRVWPTEHLIGFCLNGVVDAFFTQCHPFRSTPAASGSDFWWGTYCNGNGNIGLAGGNASVRFRDCIAEMGGPISATGASPATSKAWNVDAGFSDIWIDGCESSAVNVGVYVTGLGGNANAQLRKQGNADLLISGFRADTFGQYGIRIGELSEYAVVQVRDCYAAPGSGTSPTACYAITNSNASSSYGGAVTLTGNEAICWPAPACKGLWYQNCQNIVSQGNIVSDSQNPEVVDTVTQGRFEDSIINPASSAGNGAVCLTNSSRCIVRPVVSGAASKFSYGIQLGAAGNDHCMLDPSAISVNAVNGGSGNKVVINGSQVTTVGASGTHYVTGVMA